MFASSVFRRVPLQSGTLPLHRARGPLLTAGSPVEVQGNRCLGPVGLLCGHSHLIAPIKVGINVFEEFYENTLFHDMLL